MSGPCYAFPLRFFTCLMKRTALNTPETGILVFQSLWGYSARKETKSKNMENLTLVCYPVLPWVSSL